MKLPQRMQRAQDDQGAALVAVIGIAAVVALLSVTMVSTALFASTTSTLTRAGVQVQAATEQGLDMTLATLNTSAFRGSEASFPCQLTHSVSTPIGTVAVAVTIAYRVGAAAPACPVASGSTLTGAQFTARGTMTTLTGNGPESLKRVVQQDLTLVPAGVGTSPFGFGVFSAGDLNTTNNFKIIDGGAHTNGKFTCNSGTQILGPVTAVGAASITNVCYMKGLWTGGTFECNNSSVIDGDLTAVGAASFSNTCAVNGNVVAGGNFTSAGWSVGAGRSYTVTGSIRSATGRIVLSDVARIGGNAQAATTIARDGNGAQLSTIVAGSRTESAPSAVPVAPAVQTMPAIRYTDIVPNSSVPTLDSKVWFQQSAVANGAPTWSDAYEGTSCEASKDNSLLNGPLQGPATAMVIDARGCSQLKFRDVDLVLHDDLTIIANDFYSSNGLRVTSTKVGTHAKLRIIVPLAAGGTPCTGSYGNIVFNSGGTDLGTNVDVFLYTNGKVSVTNSVTMNGSIYGCTTSFSVNSTIKYADMTPPGMTPTPSPLYQFLPDARYDLAASA